MKRRPRFPWVWTGALLVALVIFSFSVSRLPEMRSRSAVPEGGVVLPPALQRIIYGGDSYLAANIESARILLSGEPDREEYLDFFARLYRTIATLNPCHEDSIYLAAAFLPSGGAVDAATEVLNRAVQCRFWDPWAFFFQGFHLYFFVHDYTLAVGSIQRAAELTRDPATARMFRGIAISLKARSFDDTGAAIQYLKTEEKRASDQALKRALEKRIGRLQGLALLRDAQKRFEQRYGRAPDDPADLVKAGILKQLPVDPLGIGYEFVDKRFELKEIGIAIRGKR